jgi:hypothetical protein
LVVALALALALVLVLVQLVAVAAVCLAVKMKTSGRRAFHGDTTAEEAVLVLAGSHLSLAFPAELRIMRLLMAADAVVAVITTIITAAAAPPPPCLSQAACQPSSRSWTEISGRMITKRCLHWMSVFLQRGCPHGSWTDTHPSQSSRHLAR